MAPAGRLLFLPLSCRDPSAFARLRALIRDHGTRLATVSVAPGSADMWPVDGPPRAHPPGTRPVR